jgi:hypothetical protein
MKKILLLILVGIGMLVACSKDDSYIIIGCGGLGVESEYIKEQSKPENHDYEHKPNEIMKTSDTDIH